MTRSLALLAALAFTTVTVSAEGPVELKGHKGLVYGVAFSPDGKQLASAGTGPLPADNVVKLWDVIGQKEIKTLKGPTAAVTGVVFTPDGKSVLAISHDRFIHQWDVATGMESKKI